LQTKSQVCSFWDAFGCRFFYICPVCMDHGSNLCDPQYSMCCTLLFEPRELVITASIDLAPSPPPPPPPPAMPATPLLELPRIFSIKFEGSLFFDLVCNSVCNIFTASEGCTKNTMPLQGVGSFQLPPFTHSSANADRCTFLPLFGIPMDLLSCALCWWWPCALAARRRNLSAGWRLSCLVLSTGVSPTSA